MRESQQFSEKQLFLIFTFKIWYSCWKMSVNAQKICCCFVFQTLSLFEKIKYNLGKFEGVWNLKIELSILLFTKNYQLVLKITCNWGDGQQYLWNLWKFFGNVCQLVESFDFRGFITCIFCFIRNLDLNKIGSPSLLNLPHLSDWPAITFWSTRQSLKILDKTVVNIFPCLCNNL